MIRGDLDILTENLGWIYYFRRSTVLSDLENPVETNHGAFKEVNKWGGVDGGTAPSYLLLDHSSRKREIEEHAILTESDLILRGSAGLVPTGNHAVSGPLKLNLFRDEERDMVVDLVQILDPDKFVLMNDGCLVGVSNETNKGSTTDKAHLNASVDGQILNFLLEVSKVDDRGVLLGSMSVDNIFTANVTDVSNVSLSDELTDLVRGVQVGLDTLFDVELLSGETREGLDNGVAMRLPTLLVHVALDHGSSIREGEREVDQAIVFSGRGIELEEVSSRDTNKSIAGFEVFGANQTRKFSSELPCSEVNAFHALEAWQGVWAVKERQELELSLGTSGV